MITKKDYLVAFERVAQLGSVHAAARDLNLTQTAVTQRIRLIEAEMELSLFLRSRKGMTLTNEGHILLRYFKSLQELDAQYIIQLRGETRNSIDLRLLAPTSAISGRIASDCEPLFLRYPFLNLHLSADDGPSLVEKLKQGAADFVVVSPHLVPKEMDSKYLKPDEYVLVCTSTWKTRSLKEILKNERLIDFSGDDQMTTNYLRKFGLLTYVGRPRLFINQNDILRRYYTNGIGFGVFERRIVQPFLKTGELILLNRGDGIQDPLALVWSPRRNKSDYIRDLIKCIK